MTRRRTEPTIAAQGATTAGFRVSVKGRRVILVDTEGGRDPGMSHHEAKDLAQRLLHAAAAAERARPFTRLATREAR
jgi:hypothetical protein